MRRILRFFRVLGVLIPESVAGFLVCLSLRDMMRLLRTWSCFRQPAQDYTPQATTLFSRFAERHGLAYQAVDAPVEILWEFPEQVGLSLPMTLGLQNNDELNFGVPG